MSTDLQRVQRDFRLFYEQHIRLTPAQRAHAQLRQSLEAAAAAQDFQDVDPGLSWSYELCATAHYSNPVVREDSRVSLDITISNLQKSFPAALGELRQLVQDGVIPSLEAGFTAVVESGIRKASLEDSYEGKPALSEVYQRARNVSDKVALRHRP